MASPNREWAGVEEGSEPASRTGEASLNSVAKLGSVCVPRQSRLAASYGMCVCVRCRRSSHPCSTRAPCMVRSMPTTTRQLLDGVCLIPTLLPSK